MIKGIEEYDITIMDKYGKELKSKEEGIPIKLKKFSSENKKPFLDLGVDFINFIKINNFKLNEITIGLGISHNGNIGLISGDGNPTIFLRLKRKG